MTFYNNFRGVLNLPLVSSASNAANMVIDNAKQQIINYSSPASALKQTENLQKLSQNGTAEKFTQASGKINLAKSGGQILAVDQSNNTTVAVQNTAFDTPAGADIPMAADNMTSQLKVKISQLPHVGSKNEVILDVMPTISESRTVAYDPFSPSQHPGDILKYRGTSSRSWTISAKLVSRTSNEATNNLITLNTIRSWAMPFYGLGTATDSRVSENLGGPPPILTLKAYGEMCIGPVPCVLENYSTEWPNDCDYLPAIVNGQASPFPAIMTVSLTLKESYSPSESSGFSLADFKSGNLSKAFAAITAGEKVKDKPNRPEDAPAQGVSTSEPSSVAGPNTSTGQAAKVSDSAAAIATTTGTSAQQYRLGGSYDDSYR